MSDVKFRVKANIPIEHVVEWLKHIAEFDVLHPGCSFQMEAESDHTREEVAAMMEESGAFETIIQMFAGEKKWH